MFRISDKVQSITCPMHKKAIKYLNIGQSCSLEQRVGCSSCMGGNFIDFELAEELLDKLNNGNNEDDMKQQLKIDFMHTLNQFRNQVNKILDNMEKLVESMNSSSDKLIEWLNQIRGAAQFNIDDLKQIAVRLGIYIVKQEDQFQPRVNGQWQNYISKYAQILQKTSLLLNQKILEKELNPIEQSEVVTSEEPKKNQEFVSKDSLQTKQDIGQEIQQPYVNQQMEIDEQKKKIEFLEGQIEKYHNLYNKLRNQNENKEAAFETPKANMVINKQEPEKKEEQQQYPIQKQDKDQLKIQKYLDEKTVNHPLWKEFNNEMEHIKNQLKWLEFKYVEQLFQFNQSAFQEEQKKVLHFSKKTQENQNFSKFYLNQLIAQLQTINKLLLDSQTMYKMDNIVVSKNYQDEQDLKKKVQETIDYIRSHKQHLDVCQVELKYVQELMSINELSKCNMVNSRDLQKYFQRLTDKNKYGIFYINNNVLLKNSRSLQQVIIKTLQDSQLKDNLQIDKDFIMVNKFAWKFISTLYFSSGPEILLQEN
ncbi:unnamed protein product (macronuclear) [Paramecium tetraurelia]|uniref:DUSP domain-containing protein n=1 Tax=Paramecium tetraurelia TaxID=5888 RepID=A0D6K8_PARTE|nr:uncharacterized protein GSPATT00001716001 [Paramecium tetraurelia]CAK78675.1 unnamed protein product [Paramecium tetraurelia]|eukprot:XP_001446072.1 hypothetical protein (macronuclear) [Paramecium tetraurelia strain d4-2]